MWKRITEPLWRRIVYVRQLAHKATDWRDSVTTVVFWAISMGLLIAKDFGLDVANWGWPTWLQSVTIFVFFCLGLLEMAYRRCGKLENDINAYKEKERPKIEVLCNDSIYNCYSADNEGVIHYLRLYVKNITDKPLTGGYGKFLNVEKNGQVHEQGGMRLPFMQAH